jgi:DNA-binding transcriptional LysR family regulator
MQVLNTTSQYQLIQKDIKGLIALVCVVEAGNVYGAAIMMGCSQPAVSVYLKQVQKLFNDRLFTRHGRSLIPTEYAMRLVKELRVCFDLVYSILYRC